MQFSDTSSYTGLVQDTDFLLWGTSTGTSAYAIADKTRNMNSWYDRTISLIMQADTKWQWDDTNLTDLPIATTSLVANQQDYSITDSGFLKILKVECKNSSGDWQALHQIDWNEKKDIAMDEYRETAGNPVEFDLLGNSIFLYPKPSYASSAGLKVYYQRTPDYFTSSDTTQEPGFATPFHRILSLGAAYDYALANGMTTKITILEKEIAKMESAIIDFYSTRNKDLKNRISIEQEDYSADSDYIGQQAVGWSS